MQLEEKVGHESASFLMETSSEHVLLPERTQEEVTYSWPELLHAYQSPAAEDCIWKLYNEIILLSGILSHLREEKPALKYFVLGSQVLQSSVTLTS